MSSLLEPFKPLQNQLKRLGGNVNSPPALIVQDSSSRTHACFQRHERTRQCDFYFLTRPVWSFCAHTRLARGCPRECNRLNVSVSRVPLLWCNRMVPAGDWAKQALLRKGYGELRADEVFRPRESERIELEARAHAHCARFAKPPVRKERVYPVCGK